jgi:hypothetical protein
MNILRLRLEINLYDKKLQTGIWALGLFKVTHAKFVLL